MAGPVPHFLHVFSTFVPAGPETRAVRLIEAFGGEFRHSIVAMDGRTEARELLPAGAEVKILDAPPKAGSIATVRRLKDLLREQNPDLLLSYNWGAFDAVMAARILKLRRVVHHEDGFNPDEVLEFKRRRVLARRFLLPGVHRVIVPSKKLERIAVETWKLPSERVRWIPNGIRAERFEPRDGRPELRESLGIPKSAPLVGFVGHLRPEKNPLRLLRACARIDPALGMHVLVVGEGEERPALEALVAKSPSLFGRVHFAGHVADPREHYRAMDVFCLSSDTEQMPVALLEAMASGLAIVSTDVGDVRAILPDEESPYVVPIEERESAWPIAEKLTVLVAGSRERERLGTLNRARVHERFTFEGMLGAYLDVYRGGLAA